MRKCSNGCGVGLLIACGQPQPRRRRRRSEPGLCSAAAAATQRAGHGVSGDRAYPSRDKARACACSDARACATRSPCCHHRDDRIGCRIKRGAQCRSGSTRRSVSSRRRRCPLAPRRPQYLLTAPEPHPCAASQGGRQHEASSCRRCGGGRICGSWRQQGGTPQQRLRACKGGCGRRRCCCLHTFSAAARKHGRWRRCCCPSTAAPAAAAPTQASSAAGQRLPPPQQHGAPQLTRSRGGRGCCGGNKQSNGTKGRWRRGGKRSGTSCRHHRVGSGGCWGWAAVRS